MHPGVDGELVRVRHAELLREAARERQIRAARRAGAIDRTSWRHRTGLAVVRLGEAIAGAGPRRSPTVTPGRAAVVRMNQEVC